jgi:hypothetical protein
MIVNQDHAGGAFDHGRSEHLSGVDEGRIQDSPGNQDGPNDSMLRVQEKGVEFFLLEISEEGPNSGEDVTRTSYGSVFSGQLDGGPPPQLQGSHDSGGRCRTDPGMVFQDSRWQRGETTQGTSFLTPAFPFPILSTRPTRATDPLK